jgi:hypothetical protein
VKTRRHGALTGTEAVKVMALWCARTRAVRRERWWLQTRLSAACEVRRRSGCQSGVGSDRDAVGRRLCGTGAGAWQPRGDGMLTGGPGAERERLTSGTPQQRIFMTKTSSRGVRCPRSIACGVACSTAARQECQYSLLCKGNIHVIKFIYLRHWFSVFTF